MNHKPPLTYMQDNGIVINGLLIGHCDLVLGTKMQKRLRRQIAEVAAKEGAAEEGITVDAKLWRGSPRVTKLLKGFQGVKDLLKAKAAPWVKGHYIFRSDRAMEVKAAIEGNISALDDTILDVIDHYDLEVDLAIAKLGGIGDRRDYPTTADQFREGIVRRFVVNALASTDQVASMIGGAVGRQMADEAKMAMHDQLVNAQLEGLRRIAKAVRRIGNSTSEILTTGKQRQDFKIRPTLISDLNDVLDSVSDLLLEPQPEVEGIVTAARELFRGMSKELLDESPDAREQARKAVEDMSSMLEIHGIIV